MRDFWVYFTLVLIILVESAAVLLAAPLVMQ